MPNVHGAENASALCRCHKKKSPKALSRFKSAAYAASLLQGHLRLSLYFDSQ